MQKLLISVVALVVSLPSVACAENFTGAYAGLGLGVNVLHSGYRQAATNSFDYASSTNTNGMLFNGALFGGYGKAFGLFYVGGEISLAYSTRSVEGSRLSGAGGASPGNVQSTWSTTPTVRLGALIAPRTLGYVKIGAANTHFEVTEVGGSDSNQEITKYKKNIWGFSTGAGLETLVTEKFSLRLDYTLNLYPKKTFTVGGGPTPDNAKIMPRENIIRLGLAYNF